MTNISHLKTILLISAVVLIFDILILVESIHVVIVYDCLDVLHPTVARLNFIYVEYVFFLGNGYLVGVKKTGLFSL